MESTAHEETAHEEIENLLGKLKGLTSLEQIVDVASKALNNPIILYDIAYIRWHNTKNVKTDDPLWNEFASTGTFSPKTVAFVQKHFVDSYVNASGVAYMPSPLKYDRINGSIFDKNGVQIANILMLEYYRPFNSNDYALLNALCEFVGKIIETNGTIKQSRLYGETFLSQLLENKPATKEQYDEIDELKSELKRVIYVGVVDIMRFDPTLTHIVYFCEYFKKLRADFKYFVYLNNIVVIMSFDNVINNMEKELSVLDDFFKEYNFFMGISSHFFDTQEINTHFKQALNALNYGMIINSITNIFCYDIFRIELFVNSHLDETDISQLCHPLVFQIADFDKANSTNFWQLIYASVLHGNNQKQAAKSMNLRPKAFKRELKKACRLFGIDFKNGNFLFSLFRSMRLQKCFLEKQPLI